MLLFSRTKAPGDRGFEHVAISGAAHCRACARRAGLKKKELSIRMELDSTEGLLNAVEARSSLPVDPELLRTVLGTLLKGHPCYRMLWEGPSCEGVWWDRKVKIPYR